MSLFLRVMKKGIKKQKKNKQVQAVAKFARENKVEMKTHCAAEDMAKGNKVKNNKTIST